MSLTGTCLRCHANKAEFCDRCHAYAGVSPTAGSATSIPRQLGGGVRHEPQQARLLGAAGLSALGAGRSRPDARRARPGGRARRPPADDGAGTRWAMVIDVRQCRRQDDCTTCIEACHRGAQRARPIARPGPRGEVDLDGAVRDRVPVAGAPTTTPAAPARRARAWCSATTATTRRACASARPRRPGSAHDGIVMMDWHRCIGCRYCMAACPYGSRSFNWMIRGRYLARIDRRLSRRARKGVVEKCTSARSGWRGGNAPACVEACREKALVFGDLDDPHSEVRRAAATRGSRSAASPSWAPRPESITSCEDAPCSCSRRRWSAAGGTGPGWLRLLVVIGSGWPPTCASYRPGRHRPEPRRDLGSLHRPVHVPGRRGGLGGDGGPAVLPARLQGLRPDHDPGRVPRHRGRDHVHAVRLRGHGPAGARPERPAAPDARVDHVLGHSCRSAATCCSTWSSRWSR